jgi:hypothetical protein
MLRRIRDLDGRHQGSCQGSSLHAGNPEPITGSGGCCGYIRSPYLVRLIRAANYTPHFISLQEI